ncbi:hypothetical protein HZP37_08440 [Elizabethkingia anophelis]|nr:hypothetical protein [Elizabethkingia anophelis]
MKVYEIIEKFGLITIVSGIVTIILTYWFNKKNIIWKSKTEENLTKLNNELSHKSTLITTLMNVYNSNYGHGQERRIKSIDLVWSDLCDFIINKPTYVYLIYNIFTNDEIYKLLDKDFNNNEFIEEIVINLKDTNFQDFYKKHSDLKNILKKERPFLGDEIWYSINIYLSVITRISLYTQNNIMVGKIMPWYNDNASIELLKKMLNNKEIDYITNSNLQSIDKLIDVVEALIIKKINKVLTGEDATEKSIMHLNNVNNELLTGVKNKIKVGLI